LLPAHLVGQKRGHEAESKETKRESEEAEEVAPTEDLMREHGVLKRVLLVYPEVTRRVNAREDVPPEAVKDSAGIIRRFYRGLSRAARRGLSLPAIREGTHKLPDLTGVLRLQHRAGRRLTDQITQAATAHVLKDPTAARPIVGDGAVHSDV